MGKKKTMIVLELENMKKGFDQHYYSPGKLLLTGEYLVTRGAKAFAIPVSFGQSLDVSFVPSFKPKLHWKSFRSDGSLWFKQSFEFWHFNFEGEPTVESLKLQEILRAIRKENPHFLRDEGDVLVETHLDYPLEWGLGSSSSLINNLAKWANVSAFLLAQQTFGGSGYDIASAKSQRPLIFHRTDKVRFSEVSFNPSFKDRIFFVYQGKKQDTQVSLAHFKNDCETSESDISFISYLTEQVLKSTSFDDFEKLIIKHDTFLSKLLKRPRLQHSFSDFSGTVKPLGAWGGDFMLVLSRLSYHEVKKYFQKKGLSICFSYHDMIKPSDREYHYEASS